MLAYIIEINCFLEIFSSWASMWFVGGGGEAWKCFSMKRRCCFSSQLKLKWQRFHIWRKGNINEDLFHWLSSFDHMVQTCWGFKLLWGGSFHSYRILFFVTYIFSNNQQCNLVAVLILQHTSVDGYAEPHVQPAKASSRQNVPRSRNSITSTNEDHPHIGNYRLLKTIGKGNFAKVKLARHVLTGREVSCSIVSFDYRYPLLPYTLLPVSSNLMDPLT